MVMVPRFMSRDSERISSTTYNDFFKSIVEFSALTIS